MKCAACGKEITNIQDAHVKEEEFDKYEKGDPSAKIMCSERCYDNYYLFGLKETYSVPITTLNKEWF